MDESAIVLTLTDGSEQVIPYSIVDDILVLDNRAYLTPEEVESDLQGYWGLKTSSNVLGINGSHEYIYFFDHGNLIFEDAATKYRGAAGEYYYYGPYEGTYTIDENGLTVQAHNNWQFAFNIIDGKAVMIQCGHVCSRVYGFKGKDGYSF